MLGTYKIGGFITAMVIGVLLLAMGLLASLSWGVADISLAQVWASLVDPAPSPTKEQLIIRTLRLPRAVVAACVGAGLAVAGALMQAITQNPLASPQIFGINAGASLIVVGSIVLFPFLTPSALVYFAFAGAALGGILVYTMGSAGGRQTPVKLALAGTAVSMLLSAMTEGLILLHDNKTQSVLFWLAGAVDGADWNDVYILLPWMAAGLLIAQCLGRSVTLLSLGEDTARGLGQRVRTIRLLSGGVIIVLAGTAVAVAGPIGFVGLVIPHIAKRLTGVDFRFVIPLSALLGAVLLVFADIASRYIAYPYESPVGIVTAVIGAPFFLYLIRKGRQKEA
ncbi:MAG: iron-siderophore transporter permease [Paenibacillus sp.]|jgi:iron complex transport system permease protein|nr:iron-siderophore transporter permease [Paenibacillus sp.]